MATSPRASDQPCHAARIPGYEIERELGRGGMGTVYLGRRSTDGRPAAVKLLSPALRRNEEYRERFRRAAQDACQLTSHPRLVQTYSFGECEAGPYLVMEYVHGQDLQQALQNGPMSPERVVEVGLALAEALSFVHENRMVHRDVKPENVLLGKDGAIKLSDLGLAKRADAGRSGVSSRQTCLGTPEYMSPEQVRRFWSAGPPGDVYSAGATLYHALYGQPPFSGGSTLGLLRQVLHAPVRFPEREDAPPHLVSLLNITLRKSSEMRFRDGGELLRNLKLVELGAPPRDPFSDAKHGSRRKSLARAWLFAAAVAAILGALLLKGC